jgi:hypothetical protein
LSSGCCPRSWRTVRETHADSPQGGFQLGVLRVRHEFFRVFRSIHFVGGFLVHEVWRMVRELSTDGPRVADGP